MSICAGMQVFPDMDARGLQLAGCQKRTLKMLASMSCPSRHEVSLVIQPEGQQRKREMPESTSGLTCPRRILFNCTQSGALAIQGTGGEDAEE